MTKNNKKLYTSLIIRGDSKLSIGPLFWVRIVIPERKNMCWLGENTYDFINFNQII